jgi:antitoxin (DNA-binding transcriptional repressor) of toxin-antitoxin stability system
MPGKEDLFVIGLNDLHHRSLEVRDHLLKGDKMLLTRRGHPLASIKPLTPRSRPPSDALVRSISYIRKHKREFTIKLMQGNKIILTYRGKKIGLVSPR